MAAGVRGAYGPIQLPAQLLAVVELFNKQERVLATILHLLMGELHVLELHQKTKPLRVVQELAL